MTFRTVTDDCNTATTSGDGSDAGGGILSEGGNVTTNAGSIVGNRATATGGGTAGTRCRSSGARRRWATPPSATTPPAARHRPPRPPRRRPPPPRPPRPRPSPPHRPSPARPSSRPPSGEPVTSATRGRSLTWPVRRRARRQEREWVAWRAVGRHGPGFDDRHPRRHLLGFSDARVECWAWVVLLVATPILLALDLFVLPRGREPSRPGRPSGGRWCGRWWAWPSPGWCGSQAGEHYAVKYTTGFAVEKALTVDQALVFALVVTSFAAPSRPARRAIFLALWIGLLLKLPFIAAGHRHRPLRAREPALGDRGRPSSWAAWSSCCAARPIPTRPRTGTCAGSSHRIDFTDDWRGDRFVVVDDASPTGARAGEPRPTPLHPGLRHAGGAAHRRHLLRGHRPAGLRRSRSPASWCWRRARWRCSASAASYWWVTSLEVDRVKLRIALAIVLWLVALETGARADTSTASAGCLPELVFVVIAWPLVSARRRRGRCRRALSAPESGSDPT